MRKVAYILSFGHSGSTLLSLMLEQNPQTVAIGEIHGISKKLGNFPNDKKCSCGEVIRECPLWGDFYQSIQDRLPINLNEEYQLLFNSFSKNFSAEKVLVDSSKVVRNLQELQTFDDVDLRVIFLIKDVRSFLVSKKRKAIKKGEKFGLFQTFKYALIWYRDNQGNLNYLEKNNINHLKMGYEELCLYSQDANIRLFEFLEVETNQTTSQTHSGQINSGQGHMVLGNRMRKDPNKNTTVKYDNVWFTTEPLINLIGLFLPRVAKFNRKVTYSNQFEKMWK